VGKKYHNRPGPVPRGNRPRTGPAAPSGRPADSAPDTGAPFQEQDPKRRLGDYTGAGEHSRQQPSELNDGRSHET